MKDNVKVLSVKYTGRSAEVELENERQEIERISSPYLPHEDFVNALRALDPIFAAHMELDAVADRINVMECKRKSTDTSDGYIMKGLLFCVGTSFKMKIESFFLKIPYDGFWEKVDKDTDELVHLPEVELWALADEEIECFENVFEEAYKYAKEGKVKIEQRDLFDADYQDVEPDEVNGVPLIESQTSAVLLEAPDDCSEYRDRILEAAREKNIAIDEFDGGYSFTCILNEPEVEYFVYLYNDVVCISSGADSRQYSYGEVTDDLINSMEKPIF